MEIKIDTKKDSHEDIKKAIELLQRIVEMSGGYSSGSSEISTGTEVASGMAGLFGDEPVMSNDTGRSDDESKDEEEKENIQIMPY